LNGYTKVFYGLTNKTCRWVFAWDMRGEVFPSMNEDIDALIEKKENEFTPLRQRMEELKNQFITQTISFASDWYRKTTNEYVTKYHQVILNMKEEQIANMKAEVYKLVRDSEKIVKDELENPALWWHQKPSVHDSVEQYLQVGDKHPEILDHAVRHVLGRLGLILEEHRYNVATNGNTGSYSEFWFEKPQGKESGVVPYYPHLLKWTEEMQETIRKYNDQYTKARALFFEIQKLRDLKKQQQAISRWDAF
jgi:hypothetical protein